jgi:hypothetical protein
MLKAMYAKFKTPEAQAVLESQGEVGFHVSESEAVDLRDSKVYFNFVRAVALEGVTVNISRVRTRRAEQIKGTEFDQYVIVFTADDQPQQ